MANHDTALALVVIGVALTWWAASVVGKWRQKRRLLRMIRNTPQVPAHPPITYADSYYRSEFDRITAPLDEHVYDHQKDGL